MTSLSVCVLLITTSGLAGLGKMLRNTSGLDEACKLLSDRTVRPAWMLFWQSDQLHRSRLRGEFLSGAC
jgi:hypothetical protein